MILTPQNLHTSPCAGADESYEESAEREIDEEMGVKDVQLRKCFDFYHADDITRLWGRLFTCTYDGDFKLDPEEVESGKFMSVQVCKLRWAFKCIHNSQFSCSSGDHVNHCAVQPMCGILEKHLRRM